MGRRLGHGAAWQPGPQYARGAAWRLSWGAHYRALWATPVTAPVLRLATAVPGGLVPVQAGGSYQSRTLRLRAADGRRVRAALRGQRH